MMDSSKTFEIIFVLNWLDCGWNTVKEINLFDRRQFASTDSLTNDMCVCVVQLMVFTSDFLLTFYRLFYLRSHFHVFDIFRSFLSSVRFVFISLFDCVCFVTTFSAANPSIFAENDICTRRILLLMRETVNYSVLWNRFICFQVLLSILMRMWKRKVCMA